MGKVVFFMIKEMVLNAVIAQFRVKIKQKYMGMLNLMKNLNYLLLFLMIL